MVGLYLSPSTPSFQGGMNGIKRPHPDDHAEFNHNHVVDKKQKILHHHSIHHKQQSAVEPTFIPQDGAVFQCQLLRAITLALSAVGFDGARPTALEMFRSHAEEYMLHFLQTVRTSMDASRRHQPTPQDFIYALTSDDVSASDLFPHLELPQLPSVALPCIPAPPPDEPLPPDLEALMGGALSGRAAKNQRRYVPSHLPDLPARHTWEATPVYPEREVDPRKIRERATQEGILAEKALRKLVAARQEDAKREEPVGQEDTLMVNGVSKAKQARKSREDEIFEETMAAIMAEDEAAEARKRQKAQQTAPVMNTSFEMDLGFDSAMDVETSAPEKPRLTTSAVQSSMEPPSQLVNYERRYWRRGAQRDWG